MQDDTFDEIFREEGLRRVGTMAYRVHLELWWHEQAKIEVIRLPIGPKTVLKANKPYYLKSISEQGETWIRDIRQLHDWLEAHFRELHLSFSHFRNVTGSLVAKRLGRKLARQAPTFELPSADLVEQLKREQARWRQEVESTEHLFRLDTGSSALLKSHLQHETTQARQQFQAVRAEVTRQESKLSLMCNLLREYESKASAACLVFSLSSNIQVAISPEQLRDALRSVLKELTDAHRYQVTQKLYGSRLNIYVEEAREPVMVWIEQWLGGALSPRQLDKLGMDSTALRQEAENHLQVTPNEDVRMGESVKDDRKPLAARVVSTLFSRLDKANTPASKTIPPEALPARVGLRMHGEKVTALPGVLGLAKFEHCYVSGSTGSGKTCLTRVVAEEAASYKHVNMLHLDPRNQAVGLLVPENRESILSLYPDFGMDQSDAKGFDFEYYAPAESFGKELPADLSELSKGRSIVSFKGQNDQQRCELFADIVEDAFQAYIGEESEQLLFLLFVYEAHLFTKKRTSERAKAAANRAEKALDRFVREGRKFGCCAVIESQTIKAFSYDSASIRQNTNTKIFLRNCDLEVDYAGDFIGDGRQIIHLAPATAIVHNAEWGTIKIKVRPPLSKVWEFSREDTRRLVSQQGTPTRALSPEAQDLLKAIRSYSQRTGQGVNVSTAGQLLGIHSKRMLHRLLHELEHARLVRTRKLRARGQPRIIEPVLSNNPD